MVFITELEEAWRVRMASGQRNCLYLNVFLRFLRSLEQTFCPEGCFLAQVIDKPIELTLKEEDKGNMFISFIWVVRMSEICLRYPSLTPNQSFPVSFLSFTVCCVWVWGRGPSPMTNSYTINYLIIPLFSNLSVKNKLAFYLTLSAYLCS